MKKEVIKFYAGKGLHIPKLIARRPLNLTPEQIEAAAVEVYNEIQTGLEIKTIKIAGRVKEVARNIDARQYAEDRKLIDEAKEVIAEKDEKIKRLAIGAVALSVLAIIDIILRCIQ
jgi:hypothetical protein